MTCDDYLSAKLVINKRRNNEKHRRQPIRRRRRHGALGPRRPGLRPRRRLLYTSAMLSLVTTSARWSALTLACALAAGCSQPLPAANRDDDNEIAAQSLFTAASACPSAPENLPLNLFLWRTARTLDRFVW